MAWRGRQRKKRETFFGGSQRQAKGGRAAGEKSLLVGNFSRVSGKTTMSLVRFYFLEVPFFFPTTCELCFVVQLVY